MQLIVSEELIEMEEMTTDSHYNGSKRSHNRREKYAKENGKGKEKSQEVFDREITELKAIIDAIIMLLEKCEKSQNYSWTMKRKKIKWKLLKRKLKRRMYIRLEKNSKQLS